MSNDVVMTLDVAAEVAVPSTGLSAGVATEVAASRVEADQAAHLDVEQTAANVQAGVSASVSVPSAEVSVEGQNVEATG